MPTQQNITGLRVVKNGQKSEILNLSNARRKSYAQLQQLSAAQKKGVIICPDYPLDDGDLIPAAAVKYGNTTVDAKLTELNADTSKLGSLLWTNPNPSASFPAQTVTLDLSKYTLLYVEFTQGAAVVRVGGVLVEVIGNTGNGGDYTRCRGVSANSTGVTFTRGFSMSGSEDNSNQIPRRIYSIL